MYSNYLLFALHNSDIPASSESQNVNTEGYVYCTWFVTTCCCCCCVGICCCCCCATCGWGGGCCCCCGDGCCCCWGSPARGDCCCCCCCDACVLVCCWVVGGGPWKWEKLLMLQSLSKVLHSLHNKDAKHRMSLRVLSCSLFFLLTTNNLMSNIRLITSQNPDAIRRCAVSIQSVRENCKPNPVKVWYSTTDKWTQNACS